MTTRHEPPSQRRLSLEDEDEEEVLNELSARPLSTSFWTPIDPLALARLSSLDLYPQYLFPSKINSLDKKLEVPYVFSHQDAAFYWTREDALENHKLNIWAKPPCLNCVMKGEKYARRCDRYELQEDSQGQTRCCTRCKATGENSHCVELIEVRGDGTCGLTRPDISTTVYHWFDQWDVVEQRLRKADVIWWKAINLEFGNVQQKQLLVERWEESKKIVSQAIPLSQLDSEEVSWREEQDDKEERAKKLAFFKRMNQEMLAEWDSHELNLIPQLVAQQARQDEDARGRELPDDSVKAVIERDRALRLADEQEYWSQRVRVERACQYDDDFESVGRDVADTFQKAWEEKEDIVISQVCYFLTRKRVQMDSGMGEEAAIASAKAELSEEVIDQLEDLVPQIFSLGG